MKIREATSDLQKLKEKVKTISVNKVNLSHSKSQHNQVRRKVVAVIIILLSNKKTVQTKTKHLIVQNQIKRLC